MKYMYKKKIIIILLMMTLLLTGCTKSLTNPETKKVEKNPVTGQNLTENILCKPKDEESIKIYEKYPDLVNLEKLPKCENFKITTGGYEGIWNTFFVKPLAFLIIQIGNIIKNYGIGLIIASILIRLVAYPITRKTAMQSELIKKAKPDLDNLEKKYAGKTDQDSMMKKSQEMSMIYKKHKINPFSGCLFAFLQLPLFIAFLEAINRVPAIFEENLLFIQLGTTPFTALQNGEYLYLVIILIVGITTYYSLTMNSTDAQGKSMAKTMFVTIMVMSVFMNSALNIYWITTNTFTIIQNILVKRSKILNGQN